MQPLALYKPNNDIFPLYFKYTKYYQLCKVGTEWQLHEATIRFMKENAHKEWKTL